MRADSGHAPDRVVGRLTSSPLVSLRPCAPHFSASSNIARKRARWRERETEGEPYSRSKLGPRTQSSHSALPPPFSQRFPVPTLKKDSTTLARNRRQFPSARLCPATRSLYARCDVRPTVFAASLPLSLALSSRTSFCTFSFAPSNFPFIVFVASLLSSPPCSFFFFCPLLPSPSSFLSLSFLLSCNAAHTRAPHYHSREPRARNTTHMAGRPLLLRGVCGPTSCRGLCHVAPRPQRHTTRAVLSREPRTRHQSETNRETGPTEIALSLPGSACGAFSLPLFPILSLSFFLPRTLSPCTVPSSSLPFFCPSVPVNTRAIHHALETARTPVLFISPATTCNPPVLCVYALPQGSRRIGQPIGYFVASPVQVVHRGKNRVNQSCKVEFTSCSLPRHVEMETSASVSCLCRYSTVYRRRCGLCIGVVCQRVNDVVAKTRRER